MKTAIAKRSNLRFFLRKLSRRRIWEKLLRERLSEPLHLNLAAAIVAILGDFRTKVEWDLVVRPHYAYGVLHAADQARKHGLKNVTVIELGVAKGEGLFNLCHLARKTESCTGVQIEVIGFDGGRGMPPPVDYRDHPELYLQGDFPMDKDDLLPNLPDGCSLRIGPLKHTIAQFLAEPHPPIAFTSVDLDYYSSTKEAFCLFDHWDHRKYVPLPVVYFDDIMFQSHNDWCGESLAIQEFNAEHATRKLQVDRFLATRRVFKNPRWLNQMYILHLLDHPWRSATLGRSNHAGLSRVLSNDYLR